MNNTYLIKINRTNLENGQSIDYPNDT